MTTVQYAFDGRVVRVGPTTPVGEVNAALAESNVIVFLRSGLYVGNLTFSGSNVTLYGEGPRGGTVRINGSVTVNGSGNRIRGAHITGNLSVPANGFGMSLSRVDGAFQLNGSGARLLQNTFCGTVSSPTTNVTAFGNAGMAPLAQPPGC
jgi:pectin methylesterase-like acyl-CoA thioesterase